MKEWATGYKQKLEKDLKNQFNIYNQIIKNIETRKSSWCYLNKLN